MGVDIGEPSDHIKDLLERAYPQEIYSLNEAGEVIISSEKKESNEDIHTQLATCLSESLQQTSLLKDYLFDLFIRRNEHYSLSSGQAMLEAPEKSLLFEEVNEVLGFMQELNLHEFSVYKKLEALYQTQKTWREKIAKLISAPVPQVDSLTLEMRSLRNRERGIALMQTRLTEFKRLFAQKNTCEELIRLLEEDYS